MTKISEPDGFKGELDLLIRRFYSKTFDIIETMKMYMPRASAAYWRCGAVDLYESWYLLQNYDTRIFIIIDYLENYIRRCGNNLYHSHICLNMPHFLMTIQFVDDKIN